jgi:thiol-disulfide isomerase/thioredoxin
LEGDYNYLLVDFWASWCPPCRAENPNLVAVYNEYKDEGFEILGVSFDRDKEAWIEAIHEDSLAWYHVSDLKGWGNKVGKMYGIRSIPSSVILNKDGIIIAKNLSGEALREKMEELYN